MSNQYNNPWNIDTVNKELLKYKLKVFDDIYIDYHTPLHLIDEFGYKYNIQLANILTNGFNFVNRFHSHNPFTIDNIRLWVRENNKPFKLESDIFIKSSHKLKWKCLKENCGDIFNATWNQIQRGFGCGVCWGRQITINNCLATKNPRVAAEWNTARNGSITPNDITFRCNKKFWWICDKGHEWPASPANRFHNDCPYCRKSIGEQKIKEILNLYKIEYDHPKVFDDLRGKNNRQLSYDFYLPDYNLLIEYQGEFHDGNGNYFMKQNLGNQQERDKKKKDYANIHKVELLAIWYWDFDNIESILEQTLLKEVNSA